MLFDGNKEMQRVIAIKLIRLQGCAAGVRVTVSMDFFSSLHFTVVDAVYKLKSRSQLT